MRWGRGLGARISLASLAVLLVVVVVAIWVSQVRTEQRMGESLAATADSVARRLSIGLLEPVWNINEDQVRQLVGVEFDNPALDAAQVLDSSDQPMVGVQRGEDGTPGEPDRWVDPVDAFHTLSIDIIRGEDTIGSVRLWFSDRTIREELAGERRADLIKFASVGLTLVIILNLLIGRWITAPLGQMSGILGRLVELRPGEPIDAIRREKDALSRRYGSSHSEIGTLTRSLDRFVGLFGVLKDTTDSAQRAGRGLTCASANLMLLDDGGRIVLLNDAFGAYLDRHPQVRRAFGVGEGDPTGNPLDEVLSQWIGAPLRTLDGPSKSERELGGRHGMLDVSPVASDTFEVIGYVVQWHDMTELLARQAAERRIAAELSKAVGAARRGDLGVRISASGAEGVLGELATEVNHLLDGFDEALEQIQSLHDALARGDLAFRLDAPEWQGVFASVRDNANTTIERLAELVEQLRAAARSVASGSSEIRAGTDELSRRIEQQASSLEESSAAMRDMSQSVINNERDAADASRQSSAADDAAKRGAEAIARMQTRMSEIGRGSRRIMEIVGLIDDIAFQTNLLALNAAVEAARAGEMGRGFAVVAAEVRALAKRAADNAKDIRGLLTSSDAEVQQGISLAEALSQAIDEISGAVGRSATLARTIAQATTDQAQGIRQIDTVIGDLDGITQQNSAIAEQTAAASATLDDQASSVLDLLSHFSLDDDEAAGASAAPATPIARRAMTT